MLAHSAFLLSLAIVIPVQAQPKPDEPIRLNFRGAAPMLPSVKYRLLPDEGELRPGNRAAGYYRTLAMFCENVPALQEIKKEYWSKWAVVALKDLPLAEVKGKLAPFGGLVHELDAAVHKQQCDWELDGRPEGIALLLPDVQAYRTVAALLAVKARAEIAEGQFQQALHTLQLGFALGRDLGKGPSFIHILVGVAITQVTIRQVEELIQQPGAPNLYWSFTVLPSPCFTLDHALREESAMILRSLPWMLKLEDGPMSEEQVKTAEAQTRKLLDDFDVRRSDTYEESKKLLMEGAFVLAGKALLDQGMTQTQINALPKFQVVALYAVREFRQASAEVNKWNHVDNGWRKAGYRKDANRYAEASARLDLLYFAKLLSALQGPGQPGEPEPPRVANAIGRIDRRIAGLRCIEALRAYAVAHDNKLPANLKDVTELPVPRDPVLNRPFDYKVTGQDQAKLSAAAPPGEKENSNLELTYDLTLLPTK